MNEHSIFLIPMTISILIFMNLSQKFKWSEKFWICLGGKFNIDPSYYKMLSTIIAITTQVLVVILLGVLGVGRPLSRIIHGISMGLVMSIFPVEKDNDERVVGRYLKRKKTSKKSN